MSFYRTEFGSYPFGSYKVVAVDEMPVQRFDSSTLSIITVDLLQAGNDSCRYPYFSVFLVSSLITPQMLMVMSSVVFKSSKLPSLSRLTLSARNWKVFILLYSMVVVFTSP
jgi:hypothetical protein